MTKAMYNQIKQGSPFDIIGETDGEPLLGYIRGQDADLSILWVDFTNQLRLFKLSSRQFNLLMDLGKLDLNKSLLHYVGAEKYRGGSSWFNYEYGTLYKEKFLDYLVKLEQLYIAV